MPVLFVAVLLCAAAAAVADIPPPLIPYQVHPDPAHKMDVVPSSVPLAVSSTSAFVCYAETMNSVSYCQFVSPANAAFVAPRVVLNSTTFAAFDEQPQLVSPTSALYSTRWTDNSYYAFSSADHVAMPVSRDGSEAGCATNPNTFSAYVPFGVHMGDDFMLALDATQVQNITWEYHLSPWGGKNHTYPNGASLLHDVMYYNGLLLFMHNNTLYNYNATNGMLIFSVPNPCGVVGLTQDSMNLAKGTFGSDMNGALDAFIVYGNSTLPGGHAEFTVCRVSHNTGVMEWKYVMAEDFVVNDLVGGSGVLLLSGRQVTAGTLNFQTLILDAGQNKSYGFIPRSMGDYQSYPTFVPQAVMPPFCGTGIVLQQHNNLTMYCLNYILGNATVRPDMQAWNLGEECNHRPLYDPISTQLVCVTVGQARAVSLMAATGATVWMDESRSLMTQPVLMIELGVSYAFIMDLDATLYGYQIPLVAPTPAPQTLPPTPAPNGPQGETPGGMSSGAAAGLAIGVIVIAGAIGFFAYHYVSRTRRRQSYQTTNLNQEYGSVS